MPPIPREIRALAIVMPSWIGDTVMATPVLRAARVALPEARIIAIMRRGLHEILDGLPWLDESIVADMKGLAGPIKLGQAIRRAGASAVLLLPNSFRSALAARFSGAKVRVGYNRDARGWLLTAAKLMTVPIQQPVPAVEYYAELAEWAFGIERVARRIELVVTDHEKQAADELLRDVKPPFALLNPGANRADKRWSAESFAALANRLAASHHLSIVISGSPAERVVLEAVRRAAKTSIIDLSSRGTTLGALKAIIQRAAVVITNDTGPRHIAAALGRPVVTLFGPTDHRWTTLQDVRERILVAEPFLPEELVADRHPNACAIDKISVNDVGAAVDAIIDKSSIR